MSDKNQSLFLFVSDRKESSFLFVDDRNQSQFFFVSDISISRALKGTATIGCKGIASPKLLLTAGAYTQKK